MRLTKDLIEARRTPAGAYNLAQLKALGVALPGGGAFPASGWICALIGKDVSNRDYEMFLAMGRASKQERQSLFPSDRKSKGERIKARAARMNAGAPSLFDI